MRKIAADKLVEQRGLKGSIALAAIRELWKTPNEQGTRGSGEACSSCDERKKAQLPAVQAYIKARGLKGPARLGASAKAKVEPEAKGKAKANAKAAPSIGRNPEELTSSGTRTTSEARVIPKSPSDPSQG